MRKRKNFGIMVVEQLDNREILDNFDKSIDEGKIPIIAGVKLYNYIDGLWVRVE